MSGDDGDRVGGQFESGQQSPSAEGPERPAQGRGGIFQDSVRKVLVGGASALLMTEENIRSALSDVRLPKDAVSFLLSQTDRTRREVVRLVSKELKAAVNKIDLRGELRRTLLGLNVDVRATIAFREDKDVPSMRVTSKVRRRKRVDDSPPSRDARSEQAPANTSTASSEPSSASSRAADFSNEPSSER